MPKFKRVKFTYDRSYLPGFEIKSDSITVNTDPQCFPISFVVDNMMGMWSAQYIVHWNGRNYFVDQYGRGEFSTYNKSWWEFMIKKFLGLNVYDKA